MCAISTIKDKGSLRDRLDFALGKRHKTQSEGDLECRYVYEGRTTFIFKYELKLVKTKF